MSFNPEPSKQAQEVFFSRKIQKPCNFLIYLNNKLVKQVPSQENLGIISHSKLDFEEHLKNTLNKVNKTIALLRKLENFLPRGPLLTIYKSFVRPHLDYGDVIYDQHYNNSFRQKLELMQYNAFLPIVGAFKRFLYGKTSSRIRFKILKTTRWIRKLHYFFKAT